MTQINMNRRRFIAGATAIMGGSLSPMVSNAANFLASRTDPAGPMILNTTQLKTVEIIAEIIIPTTDTPGASAAGVHHLINKFVSHMFKPEQRNLYIEHLNKLADIQQQSSGQQISRIEALDKERNNHPFFKTFKQLVVFGYYTSQIGASKELQYDPVPGPYKELPLSEVGRAWA